MASFPARCITFLRLRGEQGSAAIEFGLAAPFLVLLMVAVTEVGTAAYQGMQVQNAAEAGAVYASKHGLNVPGITSAVVNATSGAGITATPAPAQFCGCPSAGGIASVQCSTVCADGIAPGYYIRISAQLSRAPILSIDGLALPATITGESVIRLY